MVPRLREGDKVWSKASNCRISNDEVSNFDKQEFAFAADRYSKEF